MAPNVTNAQRAEILTQALPYIQKYNGKIVVVKYGGNAMTSEDLKQQVMEDIALLYLIGVKIVLVHGGGPEITELLGKIGKKSEFVDGLRVTDKETVDVVQMVLAGKINKSLVNLLEMKGGKAMGISGIDGHMIEAEAKDEKLGFVGKITNVNVEPITDLLEKGYLPEAIINFIALLGWAPTGEQEIFTMDELIQAFDISGISKSPALFDPVKLKAINGEYIRKMSPEAFAEKAIPYIRQVVHSETADLQLLCHVLQPRTELFTDIPEQVDFIDALPDYDVELYRHKKMKTTPETAKEALMEILPVLEGISDWTVDSIHAAVFARIGELGVKNGWMLWPLRTALSGKPFTPGGGIELCAILGKDETLKRVQDGINRLS